MHLLLLSLAFIATASAGITPFSYDDYDDDFDLFQARHRRAHRNPQMALISAMFRDGDADKDDQLSPKEFWTVFSHFDGNGDGAITPREHLDFFMNQPALRPLRGSGGLSRMASRQFRAGDKNGDGLLTAADADLIFDNLDLNDDRLVSRMEFFSRFHTVLS